MAVNDNFQVVVTGTIGTDIWKNVSYWQCTAGGTGGQTVLTGSLREAIKAHFLPKIAAVQTNTVSMFALRCQQVGVTEPFVDTAGLNVFGLTEGDPLPSSDAVLFVKRANNGGRKNVGKAFIPGVDETLVNGNVVTVTDPTIVALAVAFKTNIVNVGDTFTPCIWHRGTATADFVTVCQTRTTIARQNRRHDLIG